MNRHDGPGFGTDGRPYLLRIQRKGHRIHIHQNRAKAEQGNRLGRRHIGKRSGDQLVPGLQAQGHHRDLQGIRPVGTGNDLHAPQIIPQFLRKGFDRRAVDKGGVLNDFGQAAVDLVLDGQVLATQVHHGAHGHRNRD